MLYKPSLYLTILAGLSLAIPTPPDSINEHQDTLNDYLVNKHRQTHQHLDSRDECTIYEPYWVGVEWPQFDEWDPSLAEIFRYRQQQSVNLGSWLVLFLKQNYNILLI